MANLKLAFHNHLADMTLSMSGGTIATGQNIALDYLKNTRRDQVMRTTNTTTTVISGYFTDTIARTCGFVGMIHSLHGASVRVQLYSDTALTSSVYDSGTVSVYTAVALTASWGLNATGAGALKNTDLLAYRRTYDLWLTPVSFKGIKVTISGTPTDESGNLSYFEVAWLHVSPYFEFSANPQFGATLARQFGTPKARDAGGGSQATETWQARAAEYSMGSMTDNDARALRQITGYSGDFRAGWLSLFPGAGTVDEMDYSIPGRFATLEPQAWEIAFRTQRFRFEEL